MAKPTALQRLQDSLSRKTSQTREERQKHALALRDERKKRKELEKASRGRLVINVLEGAAGAVLAGAIDGADVFIGLGDDGSGDPVYTVPMGGPLGLAGVMGGVYMGSPDAVAVGSGMLDFAVGDITRQIVENMRQG